MIRSDEQQEEEEYEFEQGDKFSSSEFAGLIGNPFEIESSSNSHGPNRDLNRNSHSDHSHGNNDNGRGSNKQRRSIRKPRSRNSSRFSRDHRSPSSSSWYVLLGIVCVTLGALYSKYLSSAGGGGGGDEEEDRLLDPTLDRLKSKFAKDEEVDYSQYSIHEGSTSSAITRGSLAPTPMPTEDNLIVKRIALIGERNTGLSWLQSKLEKCYPRIPVTKSLHRGSHWFQTDPNAVDNDTLVISVFLNVYDWVETMRLEPHNMPAHMNLDWYSFVSKKWTLDERPERDIDIEIKSNVTCQEDFSYDSVIPCLKGSVPVNYRGHSHRNARTQFLPIYELNVDGSGEPYKSVLELRSAKIRNFLDVKRWPRVKKFIKIHYESLVNLGLKVILDKIENGTGMKPSCDMYDEKPPIVGGLETLDEGLIHWLNDNVDWKAERRIKYNINSRPYSPLTSPTVAPDGSDVIERIALLGERNTGSRWVTKKLRECYPELKTTPSLHRWKHWFQEDPSQVYENTLVVLVSINPYDWIDAMRRVPHNMPAHMMDSWYDFLTLPWTTNRPEADFVLNATEGNICQHDFKYSQVISCIPGKVPNKNRLYRDRRLRSEFQPMYELNIDGSGIPYENILKFRSAKKENFLTVKDWEPVKSFVQIQYEELADNGAGMLIDEIYRTTGLNASCDASATAPYIGGDDSLDPDMLEWISEYTDWEIEERYGYKKGVRPYKALKNKFFGIPSPALSPNQPHDQAHNLFVPTSTPSMHQKRKSKLKRL